MINARQAARGTELRHLPLPVLDDRLRDPLNPSQARDLLELLDDRYRKKATLFAAQLPVAEWQVRSPDPTTADPGPAGQQCLSGRASRRGPAQAPLSSGPVTTVVMPNT